MDEKRDKYPSTFTIDNFSSTTTLAPKDVKIPIDKKNGIEKQQQYNPYEHRNLNHPNTFWGALIHIIKSSLGTGILAIPMAFKHSGLLVGFIGTILIGFICTHTIQILVEASQKCCVSSKTPSLGFAETAEAVFRHGPTSLRSWSGFARKFVDIALVSTYLVGGAVYIVFLADSLEQIFEFYHPQLISRNHLILIIMLLLIICCQIRPLKYLVPFSAVANVTMLVAFAITFYYMIVSFDGHETQKVSLAKGVEGLPKFLVTVIFAMEGIGTIMPVENSMIKGNFLGCPGVLNLAMTFVVCLYTTMGFFGYWIYGEGTMDSVTYNMPLNENLAMFGRGCISSAVFFTFMLQFYVPMDISWRYMNGSFPEKHHNLVQVVWRLGCVVFITAIAVSVPDLGTIIDLVGAVFLSTLGLLVPAIIDTVMNWEVGLGKFRWRLIKNVIIVLISLTTLVSGVYFAMNNLIGNKEKHSK